MFYKFVICYDIVALFIHVIISAYYIDNPSMRIKDRLSNKMSPMVFSGACSFFMLLLSAIALIKIVISI